MRPLKTPGTLSTRLSTDDLEVLSMIAFSKGLTRSELAREVLTAYLRNQTNGEETR